MIVLVLIVLIVLFVVFICFFTSGGNSNLMELNKLSVKGMKLVEHHNASDEVTVCIENAEKVLSELDIKIDVESILESNHATK